MRTLLENQHCFRVQNVSLDEALIDHTRDYGFDIFGLQRRVVPSNSRRRKQNVEAHGRRSRRSLRRTMREAQTVHTQENR